MTSESGWRPRPERAPRDRTPGTQRRAARLTFTPSWSVSDARIRAAVTALAIAFWLSAGLLLYAHVGYGALIALIARLRPSVSGPQQQPNGLPSVSVIVPAYAEESVIAARVTNLRELDYP